MRSFYLSAYACSPSHYQWDPQLETEYFNKLSQNKAIIGIEHPIFLDSGNYPIEWMVENIPNHWAIIITTLPIMMDAQKNDPHFGLASSNEASRQAAVSCIKDIHRYIHQLNHALNRQAVKAIHLHTAPRNDANEIRGNITALKQSLEDILQLDWGCIAINLEHCDAYVESHAPDKGFLTLEDELEVIQQHNIGMVINWGRSAIETRSTTGPIEHINQCGDKLKGFFFSGCSNDPKSTYGAWKDNHMPPKGLANMEGLTENGMLDHTAIQNTFNGLKHPEYLGIKVCDLYLDQNIDRKVNLIQQTIALLNG